MALYSHNGAYPATLPFRILLSDGRTRTDPTSFTGPELTDAGYVAVDNPPSFDPNTEALTWTGSAWSVGDLSVQRNAEILAAAKTTRQAAIDVERDAILNTTGTTVDSRKYTKGEVMGVFASWKRLESRGAGGAKAITAATKANPGVLTVLAHGMITGVFGTISSVVGMTELNGETFSIVSTGAGSMTLKHADTGRAINTTDFTTYVSGGTVTPVARVITGDNYVLYLTLSEVESLANSLTAWYEDIYAAGRRHKAAVEALTTVTAVEAYDSSTWPT